MDFETRKAFATRRLQDHQRRLDVPKLDEDLVSGDPTSVVAMSATAPSSLGGKAGNAKANRVGRMVGGRPLAHVRSFRVHDRARTCLLPRGAIRVDLD